MTRYLDPKNDLVFKRVFGENPDLLKSFLNALLPLPEGRQIESLEYLSNENVPDNPWKKFSIVDVSCCDNYGRHFIVEMQMEWAAGFLSRMLHNSCHTYSRQLSRGKDFTMLKSVYSLGILNDIYDKDTDEFYHHYEMLNAKNINEKIDGLEIVMVELPKFHPETWADKKMAVLWLRFLKEVEDNIRSSQVSEELLQDSEIQKALTICEEAAFTDEELYAYEHYWTAISNEKTQDNYNYNKGHAVGKEEGLAEGIAAGEAERLLLQQELAELKKQLNK